MLTEYHEQWLDSKGIDLYTAEHWGVHSKGTELVFPYADGMVKYRKQQPDTDRAFRTTGHMELYFNDMTRNMPKAFICEGESDTLCLATHVGSEHVTGISGVNGWKKEFKDIVKWADTVFVILDNDPDYNKTDKTWEQIRLDLGKRAVRVHLPSEVKDVCEFFDNFTDEDFSEYLEAAVEDYNPYHFDALDLTVEPPPYDWLVDGLICRGDISMFLGESNSGKSMLAQSLAVNVAEGRTSWLDKTLSVENPRSYILDEENPRDVILHRMKGFGLSVKGAENIRYVSDAGVRLDSKQGARKVLDEALAWEPGLIIIDSLTRVHTSSENDAGEMARVFNDGIRPLARATGATVIILHHENKGDSSNAFAKARGTTDIPAALDSGLRVARLHNGVHTLRQFKTRRTGLGGENLRWTIKDTPDGITICRAGEGIVQL